jgi:hypothetical protein
MMDVFFEDPDGKKNRVNRTTMPHRNFVIITEHAGRQPGSSAATDGHANGDADGDANTHANGNVHDSSQPGPSANANGKVEAVDDEVAEGKLGGKDAEKQAEAQDKEKPKEDLPPAKKATGGPGAASAAAPVSGSRRKYALDVSFRVEIDQHDVGGFHMLFERW